MDDFWVAFVSSPYTELSCKNEFDLHVTKGNTFLYKNGLILVHDNCRMLLASIALTEVRRPEYDSG